MKIAIFRWIDSAALQEWVDVNDPNIRPEMVETVGIVCKETDDSISVTCAYGDGIASDPLTVPKCAIKGDIKQYEVGPKMGLKRC